MAVAGASGRVRGCMGHGPPAAALFARERGALGAVSGRVPPATHLRCCSAGSSLPCPAACLSLYVSECVHAALAVVPRRERLFCSGVKVGCWVCCGRKRCKCLPSPASSLGCTIACVGSAKMYALALSCPLCGARLTGVLVQGLSGPSWLALSRARSRACLSVVSFPSPPSWFCFVCVCMHGPGGG